MATLAQDLRELRGQGSELQAVAFRKDQWSRDEARAWLREHGLAAPAADETASYWRFRQRDPEGFTSWGTLRRRTRGGRHVELVIGGRPGSSGRRGDNPPVLPTRDELAANPQRVLTLEERYSLVDRVRELGRRLLPGQRTVLHDVHERLLEDARAAYQAFLAVGVLDRIASFEADCDSRYAWLCLPRQGTAAPRPAAPPLPSPAAPGATPQQGERGVVLGPVAPEGAYSRGRKWGAVPVSPWRSVPVQWEQAGPASAPFGYLAVEGFGGARTRPASLSLGQGVFYDPPEAPRIRNRTVEIVERWYEVPRRMVRRFRETVRTWQDKEGWQADLAGGRSIPAYDMIDVHDGRFKILAEPWRQEYVLALARQLGGGLAASSNFRSLEEQEEQRRIQERIDAESEGYVAEPPAERPAVTRATAATQLRLFNPSPDQAARLRALVARLPTLAHVESEAARLVRASLALDERNQALVASGQPADDQAVDALTVEVADLDVLIGMQSWGPTPAESERNCPLVRFPTDPERFRWESRWWQERAGNPPGQPLSSSECDCQGARKRRLVPCGSREADRLTDCHPTGRRYGTVPTAGGKSRRVTVEADDPAVAAADAWRAERARLRGEPPPPGLRLPPPPAPPGPPVVAAEDQLGGWIGAATGVLTAGASGCPVPAEAHYRLVEAERLIASHDPESFQPRADYPEGIQERQYHRDRGERDKILRQVGCFDASLLVNSNPDAINGPPVVTTSGIVLGGNSRSMTLQRIYRTAPGKAHAYRSAVREAAAHYGLRAELVDQVERPALVRVVDVGAAGPAELRELVRRYNEALTQALTATASQVAQGRRIGELTISALAATKIPDETMGEYLRSTRSRGLVRALQSEGVIRPQDSSAYIGPSGLLTDDGARFVTRALVGRVIADPGTLDALGSGLRDVLAGAVPALLQAAGQGGPSWDLSAPLAVAAGHVVAMHREGWRTGSDVDHYLAQASLFGEVRRLDPVERALLEVLLDRSGPRQLQTGARRYAELASHHPDGQVSFEPRPSTLDTIRRAWWGSEDVAQRALL
jgi:hypothetical protein